MKNSERNENFPPKADPPLAEIIEPDAKTPDGKDSRMAETTFESLKKKDSELRLRLETNFPDDGEYHALVEEATGYLRKMLYKKDPELQSRVEEIFHGDEAYRASIKEAIQYLNSANSFSGEGIERARSLAAFEAVADKIGKAAQNMSFDAVIRKIRTTERSTVGAEFMGTSNNLETAREEVVKSRRADGI